MRHRKTFRKLSRTSAHRWAMLRTMVTQLIKHERIKTTVPKAKELRRVADQMVTLAKVSTALRSNSDVLSSRVPCYRFNHVLQRVVCCVWFW